MDEGPQGREALQPPLLHERPGGPGGQLAGPPRAHWWFQGRRRILRDVVARHWRPIGNAGPIVDIGCGTGEMLEMLSEFGPVIGLDASPIAVGHCRERFGDRLDVRLGRIPADLPLGAPLVTAFDVVEHLEDDEAALAGIRASVAPGGLFICTVPAFQFLWSGHDVAHHHYRRYTRRTLRRRLLQAPCWPCEPEPRSRAPPPDL